MKFFNQRWKRVLALALACMLLLGSVAVGLSMTYAAATYKERFEQPNNYETVEVNRSKTIEGLSGVNAVRSSDTARVTAAKSGGSAEVQGVSAGVAGISVATKLYSASIAIQVTNSAQISGYDLSNNGEVNKKLTDAPFSVNDLISVYTTSWAQTSVKTDESTYQITPAAKSTITWESRNKDIADFNSPGLLAPKGKGVAVIMGTFTDRWGALRNIVLLVGVDTVVGKSLLSELADAIKKAEILLGQNPNPYEEAGLGTLQTAVNAGKTVLGSTDPSDAAINGAIDAIENAIDALALKATTTNPDDPIVVPKPGDDKTVKPVPGPENVYEDLESNGSSKVPPEYIYDPDGSFKKDPPEWSGDEVPAYKDGYVYYAEELPAGSNIFVPIKEDGTKDYSNAIWGGGDKKPGGGNDRKAVQDGSVWYAEDPQGSNLWKPVNTSAGGNQGTLSDSSWKGGGADGLPSGFDNLYPIIYHDGAYYAGPFNDGANPYYIGTGSNGRFDTSGSNGVPVGHAASGDDKKLYWNGTGLPGGGGDGEFDTKPPVTLTINSSTLPNALVGTAYSENLAASGAAPITWSLVSGYGNLPSGFSLSSAGVISGTSYSEGTYTFTVKATNATGSVTQEITLVVKPGIDGLLPSTPNETVFVVDGVEWVKIRSYHDGTNAYALLVRKENYGNPVSFCTLSKQTNNYNSSNLQEELTNFYNGVIKGDQPTLWAAMVIPETGLGGTTKASMSLPTSTRAKGNAQSKDVAFALSYAEANGWTGADNDTEWWLRTPDSSSGGVYYGHIVNKNGYVESSKYCTWNYGLRPGVWVMVAP